jgi:hypothetical protein
VSDFLENVGASTSHNPTGLHGLLLRIFTPKESNIRVKDVSEIRKNTRENFFLDYYIGLHFFTVVNNVDDNRNNAPLPSLLSLRTSASANISSIPCLQ